MTTAVAATTDPLALPAFVISIVALVVAVVSVVWRIIEWRLSGPQIRVRLHLSPTLAGATIAAFVWNKGRAAVDLISADLIPHGLKPNEPVALLTRDGRDELGLPYRLEPGSSVVLETSLTTQGSYWGRKWFRCYVHLATGDIVKSPRVKWMSALASALRGHSRLLPSMMDD